MLANDSISGASSSTILIFTLKIDDWAEMWLLPNLWGLQPRFQTGSLLDLSHLYTQFDQIEGSTPGVVHSLCYLRGSIRYRWVCERKYPRCTSDFLEHVKKAHVIRHNRACVKKALLFSSLLILYILVVGRVLYRYRAYSLIRGCARWYIKLVSGLSSMIIVVAFLDGSEELPTGLDSL